jgi:hypothetical protein
MNLPPNELVFYVITAVAVAVWLAAFWFMRNTTLRAAATPPDEAPEELTPAPSDRLAAGSAEVAGRPADLSARAAACLAKSTLPLGPVKILEQTGDRVAFEALEHMGGRLFERGQMRFYAVAPDRTRIDYAVVVPARAWLLRVGWLFVVLGLVAIGIGFTLIYTLVLPSPNPAVQWQATQMVQVVHFIWPPFLFGGLYRRMQRHVRNVFDGLAHNLPYVTP